MAIPEVYQALTQAIEEGDAEAGVEAALKLQAAGHSPETIFQEAIVPYLRDLGDRFSRLECFLPDLIRAANVVKAIHSSMAAGLQSSSVGKQGKVVIGTAFGDIHDLGKNIVASMLEVNGFEVHDLGVNVAPQDFVKQARATGADIVGISCLLTTSIPYMRDVVQLIKANEADRSRFRILVGGGPINEAIARQIGADAFGADAADAVRQATALMAQR